MKARTSSERSAEYANGGVAPDLATKGADEFTGRMFEAVNGMLLDMLAAIARKDYEDRRRRQMQGQAKARAEGPRHPISSRCARP